MTQQNLSPQQRLTASRQAMVRYMQNGNHDLREPPNPNYSGDAGQADATGPSRGSWAIFKHTVKVWWHHHPANIACEMVQPLVKIYATDHPYKVLAISAGLGAAAVLIKPWRLVSVSALLASAMKTSNISGVVLSMLASSIQSATTEHAEWQEEEAPPD